jgi:hypothetical protein
MDLRQLHCVEAIDGLCSGQRAVADFGTNRIEPSNSATVILVMIVICLSTYFKSA